VHGFPGSDTVIEVDGHIGHGAVIHGARIGKNCLIGMNSVLMDDVVLGDESIVGALSFIKAGEIIPARSLVVGNPGRIIREVSDEMILWKSEGTALYQKLPDECHRTLRETEPLTVIPENRQIQNNNYKIWNNRISE
jgi:phenylacetic acid degradation protein